MPFNDSYSLSELLRKYSLQPRKSLGQNFLADPHHLAKIIEAAELSGQDIVLEIGPGPGVLTRLLVEAAGQVVAVELDPDMVKLLKNELGQFQNLVIIQADILKTNLAEIVSPALASSPVSSLSSFKVVANLPYYITSAALRHLLEAKPRPDRIVVTVQKEVAQRMVAGPGQMSLLAVSVQFYGQPAVVHRIPAGAFFPPPKVDSAVVRIDTFARPPIPVENVDYFFRVVKAGFSQKRKQLKNSLAAGLAKPVSEIVDAMKTAQLDPTRRAETLSLAEWARLVEVI